MSKVTIIIPSYNHQDFLLQRLQSIQNQTYKDWEAIIIDDKSTDNSVNILNEFIASNPNFNVKKIIVNEANSGSGYKSWQKGIELAHSEYIWIAETDDYCEATFLEETTHLLDENKNAALVFTATNYVDSQNKFLYDSSNRTKEINVQNDDFEIFKNEILLSKLPLNPLITNGSSVLFRKPAIVIPSEIFANRQMSDLFLWTHLLKNKEFIFLNKKLNFFRRHETSTTTITNQENRESLYNEYVAYINYFQSTSKTVRSVMYDYIRNFVFTKQNKKGCFYLEPLKKIVSLNKITFYSILLKTYTQVLISKIKMKLYA